MKLLSRANLHYAAARLSNMAVRPASLTAVAYFFGKLPAEQLSLIIFTVAIGMMFMSIDPYRAYYKSFFNTQPAANDFVIYIIILSSWMLVVSTAIIAILSWQQVPLPICILSVGMFIGEKIADEQLRFRLFERDLVNWSRLVIRRSGLQLAGLGICALLFNSSISFDLFLLIFSFSWIVAFFEPLYRTGRIIRRHFPTFVSGKMLRGAAFRFTSSASLMLSSFMSSAPTYFDRVITIIVDKSSLPLFLIASMSFAIIGNFVDFFFVSKIRLNLLKNDVHLREVLLRGSLWICVAAGIGAGITIITVEKLLLGHIYSFDYVVLSLIAVINILLSLTAIPQQIVYWRDGPKGIFTVELPFLSGIIAIFLLRWGHVWTLAGALTVVAIGLGVRFLLYLLQTRRRPSSKSDIETSLGTEAEAPST
jgi:hypothetical protein